MEDGSFICGNCNNEICDDLVNRMQVNEKSLSYFWGTVNTLNNFIFSTREVAEFWYNRIDSKFRKNYEIVTFPNVTGIVFRKKEYEFKSL